MTSPSASKSSRATSGKPPLWLHIGAPKTGTTFLQSVLHKNRADLRRDGVLYPGRMPSHFWASLDLQDIGFQGHRDPRVPGKWKVLVNEVERWGGPTIVSHESFCKANRKNIAQAVSDLSAFDVHVVLTARDLARQLPACWQERLKNRSTIGYREFLDSVRNGRKAEKGGNPRFWAIQGIMPIVERWGEAVGRENVHIVMVPPPGAPTAALWERFIGLTGLDPSRYSTEVDRTNTSLGAAEAVVLREFNKAIEGLDFPWPAYAASIKGAFVRDVGGLSGLKIELPEDIYEWIVQWSERAVRTLGAGGYDIVGDLEDLLPRKRPTGVDPEKVPAEARAQAAVNGVGELLELIHQDRSRTAIRHHDRGAIARRAEEFAYAHPSVVKVRDAVKSRVKAS